MERHLNSELWDRLARGRPIDGLASKNEDGRWELAAMELPEPAVQKRFNFFGVRFSRHSDVREIQGVHWRDLDFTGSKLPGLRLFNATVTNCRFDRCQLRDWRVWGTKFQNCSFRDTDLRDSALGAPLQEKRNIYSNVEFNRTDLRGTSYTAAVFQGCAFRQAKLKGIDFQTSAFVDCVFEGELNNVLFYRRGHEGEKFPPNEMINVDFTMATLRHVAFRGLTLEKVKLPETDPHIVFKNVAPTLAAAISKLKDQGDETALQVIKYLAIVSEEAGPTRKQHVLNLTDLSDTFGQEAVVRLREVFRQIGAQ